MNNHFLKFLFLGILFIVILIGNQNLGYKINQDNTLNSKILINNNLKDVNLNNFNNFNLNTLSELDKKYQEIKQDNNSYLSQDNNLSLSINNSFIDKAQLNNLNNNLNYRFILKNNFSEVIFPNVSAKIVLVADLKTNQILWTKNINQRWPIASLTKLVTSVFAFKNMDPESKITLTEKDVNVLDSGTQSDQKLQAGESYFISDLIKWMMLASRNEAAEGLANFFSREKFIAGMNDLVKSWGANFTYFNDPTGLSVSNQSTPEDIFKIVQKIYFDYPEILKISTQKSLIVKDLSNSKNRLIYNIHPFAGNPEFLGGKTGFIQSSKQNLVSIFNFKNQPIMILIMGSDDRVRDTQIIFEWLKLNFQLVD
ncbi:MAG: serine hydrolase [Patescibacteria group bacterium]|nr:serine hydrolase [Patescibacteria group bacterium]MDW8279715.1 serine hydrolase [bacterium]